MYHQAYLDTLDSNEYNEFLFWSGQISKKPVDIDREIEYNTDMKDIEIEGDLRDEYLAIQEAEMNLDAPDSYQLRGTTEEELEREEFTGMEVSELLIEMWEEDRKREASMNEDNEYSDREAFRDFIADQAEDWN